MSSHLGPNRRWDFITPEYPPEIGGVAEYAKQLAEALSRAGESVEVWAPGQQVPEIVNPSLTIQRALNSFRPRDLIHADQTWRSSGIHREMFLQWTPSGYRYHSLNFFFCFWIWLQVLRGHSLRVMFHEFAYNLSERKPHMKLAAICHRVMAMLLLNLSQQSFASSAAIAKQLSTYRLSKNKKIHVLPVPSNVPNCEACALPFASRSTYALPSEILIGHFGLWSPKTEPLLIPSLAELMKKNGRARVLFIGAGSNRYHSNFALCYPELAPRVSRTGVCGPNHVAALISICDCLFQPYDEGLTTKRTSAMAALRNGRFLISTGFSQTEKIWKDTPAVYLIAGRDTNAIAKELATVISSPERLTRGSNAARSFYERNFSIEKTISNLLAFA